ncbi:hypothetical protein SUGI_1184980 [Cryptomeria japonica]|nr:hypothetical protein SUGI_1184980 [Cryptomeria japonica]
MQNCVPLLLVCTNHSAYQGWMHLHEFVLEGGCAFEKVFGMTMWEYTVKNPEENKAFNEVMSSDTRTVMSSTMKIYEEGFKKITSLVDVGGGVGIGIHFDLPHVIASAVPIPGKVDHCPLNFFVLF